MWTYQLLGPQVLRVATVGEVNQLCLALTPKGLLRLRSCRIVYLSQELGVSALVIAVDVEETHRRGKRRVHLFRRGQVFHPRLVAVLLDHEVALAGLLHA